MTERDDRGYLIVVEGIDGTGKGTQIQLLLTYLKNTYGEDRVVFSKDPGGTPLGLEIREILFNKIPMSSLAPGVIDAMFMASHLQNWKKVVEPALKAGKIVVMDRWFYSQLAYMQHREVPLAIATAYERVAGGNADLLLFFHMDPNVAFDRANKRMAEKGEETHQSSKVWNEVTKLDAIQKSYTTLFGHWPEFEPVLVCSDDLPTTIFKFVIDIVEKRGKLVE